MIDELLQDGNRSFGSQWRGYDRGQVDAQFAVVDQELEIACATRDAALRAAADLNWSLKQARDELAELRTLYAGGSPDDAAARRHAGEIVSAASAESEGFAEVPTGRHCVLDDRYSDTEISINVPAQRRTTAVGTGRHRLNREPERAGGFGESWPTADDDEAAEHIA